MREFQKIHQIQFFRKRPIYGSNSHTNPLFLPLLCYSQPYDTHESILLAPLLCEQQPRSSVLELRNQQFYLHKSFLLSEVKLFKTLGAFHMIPEVYPERWDPNKWDRSHRICIQQWEVSYSYQAGGLSICSYSSSKPAGKKLNIDS